jgi:hypothetical protein
MPCVCVGVIFSKSVLYVLYCRCSNNQGLVCWACGGMFRLRVCTATLLPMYTGVRVSKYCTLILFQGTVSRDFQLWFFVKRLLLTSIDTVCLQTILLFFQIFTEIFDCFGASPVSTTPVNPSFIDVNNTGEICKLYHQR